MRKVWIAAVILLGVVTVGAGGGYLWLRTSLPMVDGTVALAGLGKPVSVYRDVESIPHIFAESERDAYFSLGYVHAQDRLWQMEFLRRLGAGRLAEILGERLVGTDKYIRTLGLQQVAEAVFENSSQPVRAALSAYADGVNAWLSARRFALPLEFLLLRHEPETWRPTDPLLWSRLMALRLGRNSGTERMRLHVAEALAENGLPAAMIHDLWPASGPDAVTSVARVADLPVPFPAKDSGSNGWIVHGSRTKSGKPILANDPHLRFGAPILWYLAHMEAPGLRLTGATVPGVPFMVLGHNGSIAWGMTNGGGDVEDYFLEEAVPGEPARYRTPDGSQPFEARREVIRVKESDPVPFTARRTRHGPVMSDLRPGARELAALATPALRGDDRTVEALYAIHRARGWREFEAAAQDFHTPHTNLFFAAADGDIGFVSSGRFPLRRAGDGFIPVPGASGAFDWSGFVPMAAVPRLHNPPSGFIVNANNRVVAEDYPYMIARNWGAPYRAQRIVEVLAGQTAHDIAASQALLRDTVSAAARQLLPLMLDFRVRDPRARKAVALLTAWNHEMNRDRTEPLLYAVWLRHLGLALVTDELGGAKARDFHALVQRPGAAFIAAVLSDKRYWCDDVGTARTETCGEVLELSLVKAIEELTQALGPGMTDWRWGDRHRARFDHPVLTHVPLLSRFANLSVESDGGDYTVNRGMTAGPRQAVPDAHVDGSGYRAVYDLADLRNSHFMIATGQSGNFLSRYYRSFLGRWREGDLVKIQGAEIRGTRAPHLRLIPKE